MLLVKYSFHRSLQISASKQTKTKKKKKPEEEKKVKGNFFYFLYNARLSQKSWRQNSYNPFATCARSSKRTVYETKNNVVNILPKEHIWENHQIFYF